MTEIRARYILPAALALAILSVSTASLFIRYAQSGGLPSLVIAALRLSFATLLLAPVALTHHREEIKRFTRREILLGVFSGIFLAVHFATWITSLEYTSVASSVVFVATGPLWVAILSPLILREHLSRTALAGLGLAVAGGLVIGLSDACVWQDGLVCPQAESFFKGRAMWGNFLALAGAWAVTGYWMIGRRMRAGMSLIPYIFLVYGMAALVLLGMVLISGASLLGYAPAGYGYIFLLAVLPQLVGHSTYNWALKYLPASMVAVTTLGEPIGSAVLAFLLLNENPGAAVLAGGGLILTGIFLASRR